MTELKRDPENLFPWVTDAGASYAEAKTHSAWVDERLGIAVEATEAAIARRHAGVLRAPGVQHWIGLPPETLLTPYTEFRALLERVRPAPGDTVVDLGAGYGRMGFVLHAHFPETRFWGYEVVAERVEEGRLALARHGCARAELFLQDLASPGFELPAARIYFLYDYGSREAIAGTLEDLKRIARTREILVIGRGRAARDAIEREHPWLSQVVPPEHGPNSSIYRTR